MLMLLILLLPSLPLSKRFCDKISLGKNYDMVMDSASGPRGYEMSGYQLHSQGVNEIHTNRLQKSACIP